MPWGTWRSDGCHFIGHPVWGCRGVSIIKLISPLFSRLIAAITKVHYGNSLKQDKTVTNTLQQILDTKKNALIGLSKSEIKILIS